MCFVISIQKEPKVALKDITVYKQVDVLRSNPSIYLTAYMRCKIPANGILKADKTMFPWAKLIHPIDLIRGNAIHSYSVENKALYLRDLVFEAIIPQGALYFYDDVYHEYVSTELRINFHKFYDK